MASFVFKDTATTEIYTRKFVGSVNVYKRQALDGAGNPIGGYSDALPFELDPAAEQGVVAIFGDSISHGGGSISYSPTDWDFSYASYLMFPTINLAQSGDTSAMGVERFDRDVLPFKPSYVIILIGSNSLRAGVPAGEVIADLQTLKEKLTLINI